MDDRTDTAPPSDTPPSDTPPSDTPPSDTPPPPTPAPRLLHGPRGAEVWRTTTPHGVITAHILDPDADLDTLHAWVTEPRARFWGLGDLTRDELRETYEFVDSLPTHNAYLIRWDHTPVALIQAYHPEDDPVATAYPVADGDLGLHFFRAPTLPDHAGGGEESWAVLGPALAGFLFAGPGTRRLIGEPDANNAAALARMVAMGFEAGERVHFESPHGPKDAVMAYLTRERARQ
ncbi:GNAT family N-acetyltransferase [Myceligenerans pegani]|uniref:Lysine N-acyltransferase MbtK n=1 Tax=Myceligenerans pegani TaxID=2776917 RepID=A0ABR9N4N4_9MICO|nr:GNAT family N-acetyltransferase [Myceligenerans sp. TRM 65318]MBE1878136.1 acetyltransferase [Myceligenerans sp. TRM 65318]MBE3020407.1 acetyltransferase [Myceligenerans sp. TRM 65318]